MTNEKSTNRDAQSNHSNLKRKITTAIVQCTDQQKKHKTLLTKLLSPKKLRSRKELKQKKNSYTGEKGIKEKIAKEETTTLRLLHHL